MSIKDSLLNLYNGLSGSRPAACGKPTELQNAGGSRRPGTGWNTILHPDYSADYSKDPWLKGVIEHNKNGLEFVCPDGKKRMNVCLQIYRPAVNPSPFAFRLGYKNGCSYVWQIGAYCNREGVYAAASLNEVSSIMNESEILSFRNGMEKYLCDFSDGVFNLPDTILNTNTILGIRRKMFVETTPEKITEVFNGYAKTLKEIPRRNNLLINIYEHPFRSVCDASQ
jgi:hypothetical protein